VTVLASNDAAHAATVGRRLRSSLDETLDRVAGFDPGLSQLRMAVQAVLGILLAVGGNYLFVRLTGAMQVDTHGAVLPPEQAALVHAQHHAVLIIAMLLGAMMAMVSAFVVSDPTPRGQLITTALLPIPIFGAMTIGLLLGTHRMASLVFLVLALMTGTYLRRFGPRGFAAGMLVFNGGFMGFFLHAEIPPRQVGWVSAELLIGVLASTLVRFTLFRPDNGKTLVRMQRSWVARSRRLLELSWQLSAQSLSTRRRDQLSRRLHRQLVRINESTLMIDGQLAQPGASTAAALLHQRLYDLELAVSNIARFTEALTAHTTDEAILTRLRAVLAALREDNLSMAAELATEFARSDKRRRACQATDSEHTTTHILIRRFAGSVQLFATAQAEWLSLGERTEAEHDDGAFTPAVGLFAGWLPGSVLVSARASTTPGQGRWFDRAALAPELRASIQIGVASVLAITVGDALNGQRFYWGLLATFLAFMATTNTGEQIRKALFRMGGTAIGIVIGDVAVRLTGTNTAVVLILVLVALFLGIYLIRINYMFMVIGITVTMSQLYVQLGEFSWHLLTLRLAETAIGVGAVVITVLFVVPLRSQRVIRIGVLDYFERLQAVVLAAVQALDGSGSSVSNRSEVRQLDAAHHALLTTAAPLRIGTFGANSVQLTRMLAISTAARYYARNLATGVSHWSGEPRPESLNRATDELTRSMAALHRRIEHGEAVVYVRSAALFELVSEDLEEQPASFDAQLLLRDFTLLDAAMARLAQALDMPVRDHDTDPAEATARHSVRR
jgi:uncharacterized membrane protein YccC